MELLRRIKAFADLGTYLESGNYTPDYASIAQQNPWFTKASVDQALKHLITWLHPEELQSWVDYYELNPKNPQRVGLIMAGNVPLVGFHDLLAVVLAGHLASVKPSHQDNLLTADLISILLELEPAFENFIQLTTSIDSQSVDLLIATGSDNSARYFEYDFEQIPKLIRKNRTSHAVVKGSEPNSSWQLLGSDLFDYYGRGCRSVSKLWLPDKFDARKLLKLLQPQDSRWTKLRAYQNNYQYQKALLKMQGWEFMDAGNFLLMENEALVSPIGVIYFQQYSDLNWLQEHLSHQQDKLQAVYSHEAWLKGSTSWGQAQTPGLADYADQIDTLAFLSGY